MLGLEVLLQARLCAGVGSTASGPSMYWGWLEVLLQARLCAGVGSTASGLSMYWG